MKTLYKVGDKVMVRLDLNEDKSYSMFYGNSYDGVVDEMLDFRGQIVTITYAKSSGYNIEEDNGDWNWTDEMFVLKSNLETLKQLKEM